jgi:nucleoside-diphosphate-sugar epimerase
MRVFVAGSTGAVGKILVPLLLESAHEVVALVRTPQKSKEVEALGAKAVVADALDKDALIAAVRSAEPEVIIHQLTALTGVASFRKLDEEFALTNRLRTEATETLLTAARLVKARRFIAQSFCGWPFAREGGPVKTEDDPLDPTPPASFRKTLAAIRYLEDAVRKATGLEALAMRYGFFYGPGTSIAKNGSVAELLRKRQIPIVGDGAGLWSFIHIEDAARATVAAISRGAPGIYNIVDDEPAPVSTWLPVLADILGAKRPRKVPVWLAKLLIGEGGVSMMTQSEAPPTRRPSESSDGSRSTRVGGVVSLVGLANPRPLAFPRSRSSSRARKRTISASAASIRSSFIGTRLPSGRKSRTQSSSLLRTNRARGRGGLRAARSRVVPGHRAGSAGRTARPSASPPAS